MPKQAKSEIESLNIGDLDVEELEQRLELATAGVDGDCWVMDCGTYTPSDDPGGG